MDTFVDTIVGFAWLAIAVMLLWGLADGVRKVLSNPAPLAFFRIPRA